MSGKQRVYQAKVDAGVLLDTVNHGQTAPPEGWEWELRLDGGEIKAFLVPMLADAATATPQDVIGGLAAAGLLGKPCDPIDPERPNVRQWTFGQQTTPLACAHGQAQEHADVTITYCGNWSCPLRLPHQKQRATPHTRRLHQHVTCNACGAAWSK